MEAEERPNKLRKLNANDDYGSRGDTDTSLQPDLTGAITDSLDASHSLKSKPQERAANVAIPPAGEEDSGDQDEGEEVNEPDFATEPSQQNGEATKPMSKNQIKKLRKREEWEAARGYRKAKRKQKLLEKRARKRAAREEEEQHLVHAGRPRSEQNGDALSNTAAPQPPSKPKYRRPILVPMAILIDCGFDSLMLEKERISLGSQITRSYSDNSRAPFQTHLVISSWGGLLKQRFDTVLDKHYLNWKGVRFEEGNFVEAAGRAEEAMRGQNGGRLAGVFEQHAANNDDLGPGALKDVNHSEVPTPLDAEAQAQPSMSNGEQEEVEQPSLSQKPESAQRDGPSLPEPPPTSAPVSTRLTQHAPKGEIIYLTSDSPDTLTTLSPYSTYIVGGLVDKNRHKGICYKTAREHGIRTAKLPIGEYLDMQSRKVLATNHVVEIMLRYLECGDWGEAFLKVIPKRKGGRLRGDGDARREEDQSEAEDGTGEGERADELEENGEDEEAGEDGLQNAEKES